MKQIAILVAVFALLSGCVGKLVPLKSQTVRIEDDGRAWSRSVRALVLEGFVITTKDESAGIIQTEWRDLNNTSPGNASMQRLLIGTTAVRQMRLVVILGNGQGTVRPEVRTCVGNDPCQPVPNLSPQEKAVVDRVSRMVAALPPEPATESVATTDQ